MSKYRLSFAVAALCAATAALSVASLAISVAEARDAGFAPWGADSAAQAAHLEAEFDRALERADAVFEIAHAGQLSPKDRCHKHKAAGERHWHKEGTTERGGPCVKVDGGSWKLTKHGLCAKERVALVRAKDKSWGANYSAVAEQLKDCIIRMNLPRRL